MRCHECGDTYKRVCSHWRQSECRQPKITEEQEEIIKGALMGDGYINRQKTPSFCMKNTNKEYLEYLSEKLSHLVTSIKLTYSAEEAAQRARKTGLNKDASAKNYSEQYTLNGRAHPELERYEEWYSTGKKVFPENIELTPTILKHWYVCDGTWNKTGYSNYISIGVSNEKGNQEKLEKIIQHSPVNSFNWNQHKRRGSMGGTNCIIEFSVENSKKLWKWMGQPIPGFEYKWPDKYIYKD